LSEETRKQSTVVMVGLGHAAGFIVDALGSCPNVRILAGVDPMLRGAFLQLPAGIPVFDSVQEVPPSLEPDLAVVATPTSTHVDVCRELLVRQSARRILCEKPLATAYEDADAVLDQAASQGVRLDVLYHYAFAPDVAWTMERWSAIKTAHGDVRNVSARFDDPKDDITSASRTFVSSWADAGINALSVLARFVGIRGVSWASGGAPSVCRATLEFDSGTHVGEGLVTTSWAASEVLKATNLGLADGTIYTLDHAEGSVTRLGEHGREVLYSAPRRPPLPTMRYRRMLDAYLADDDAIFDLALTRRLHHVLAEGFERNTRRQ
jgi:predicted dehydrogenase